jgi:anti-sigma factor RsiW
MRQTANELTCREVVDFLADYLAGELEPDTRAVFEQHLAGCPACVAYLRTYAETIRLAKAACQTPDDPVAPEVPDELLRAILAARQGR